MQAPRATSAHQRRGSCRASPFVAAFVAVFMAVLPVTPWQ